MTKLIAYLRVSTSDQAENGVGMDAQLHACHTYAKRDGMEITQVFRDEGIKVKLNRQYEAIESGVINLQDVGGRIRDLKFQREQIEERLDELKQNRTIPLHFFKDESISEFQQTIKDLFLGENSRPMTKRYLQLFIEKLVIKLPKVDIVGKSDMILAVLENKKAVRTDGVLTAVDAWPSTDSNLKLNALILFILITNKQHKYRHKYRHNLFATPSKCFSRMAGGHIFPRGWKSSMEWIARKPDL